MRLTRFDTLTPVRLEKTPEGFLKGEVRVTRAGIFNYQKADGSIERELRHPNEVFDTASLDTLKLIPIVDDNSGKHPGMINASNAKEFSVGTVGEQIKVDQGWVVASVVIRDADSVKRAESGERVEVSLGYVADVDEEPGTFDGQRFDSRQQRIRYNHLAIVDSARAGPEARLRLDSTAAVLTSKEKQHMDNAPKTVTVKLDGIDYVASPEVANALAKAQTTIADGVKREDGLKVEVATAKKEGDTQKARADQLDADLKTERASLGDKVKARTALLDSARRVLGDELKADGTDDEIRKAAILKAHPDTKLDGVSGDYLRARFDAVIENLGEDAIAQQRADTTGGAPAGGKKQEKVDSKAARERYVERLRNPQTPKTGTDKE